MSNLIIRRISCLEKVFPDRMPSSGAAPLEGLAGECISFQFALYLEGDRGERVKITAKGEGAAVSLRQVSLVPCEYPAHPHFDGDYLDTAPGLYPDLLEEIPHVGVALAPGQWKGIWVELSLPEQAEGRDVSLSFSFTLENGLVLKREAALQVIPRVLPPLAIPHTEWLHTDCLANYYDIEVFSEAHWQIIEKFIACACKRGCNMILTPLFTPPLDTAVGGERRTVQLMEVYKEAGGYRFDFQKLERWVNLCLGLGIRYFEMSHLFSQWGAVSTPKIVAREGGKACRLFGWETQAGSREYRAFLGAFLPVLKEKLRELGIEKQVFFHISDEPKLEQLPSYREACQMVAEELREYPIIDALSDFAFYKEGLVKNPVCAIDHMEPFLEAGVDNLWTYYCTGQGRDVTNRFIAMPGSRTRILGLMLYKFNIKGFLHWGFNFYNSQYSLESLDPFRHTDAKNAFPSGDPFLVYPGRDGCPLESMRLMYMEQAMNDYRLCRLLERLAGREAVMECIEFDGLHLGLKDYPRGISYLETVRQKLHKKLMFL